MTQTIGGEIELSRLNSLIVSYYALNAFECSSSHSANSIKAFKMKSLIVHAACDCILAQRRETAPGTVVEIAQCKL